MSAIEQTGPPCIIDLTPRWRVDAALFLGLSAALLVWGLAVGSPRASAVGFVAAAAAALLADRLTPTLTDPTKIADQSTELPIGASHQSMARYLVTAVLVTTAFVAISLAIALVLGTSSEAVAPLAGISAAIGITRLIGLRRLRRLERQRHIRLSARAGGFWQRRPPTYYARPNLGF